MGLLVIINRLTLLNLNINVLQQKPSFKAPRELSTIIAQITFLVFPLVTCFVLFYSSECGGISSYLSQFHANIKGNTGVSRSINNLHLVCKYLCETL